MISESAVVIFVVSPDSSRSKVCDEEIVLAKGLGKRLIPILRRPIDFSQAPPRLAALNVKLDFTDEHEETLAVSFQALLASINRDIEWLRFGARLAANAKRWDDAERSRDYLVRGAELRRAEDQITRGWLLSGAQTSRPSSR